MVAYGGSIHFVLDSVLFYLLSEVFPSHLINKVLLVFVKVALCPPTCLFCVLTLYLEHWGCCLGVEAGALLACPWCPIALVPSFYKWLFPHQSGLSSECGAFCLHCRGILSIIWIDGEPSKVLDHLQSLDEDLREASGSDETWDLGADQDADLSWHSNHREAAPESRVQTHGVADLGVPWGMPSLHPLLDGQDDSCKVSFEFSPNLSPGKHDFTNFLSQRAGAPISKLPLVLESRSSWDISSDLGGGLPTDEGWWSRDLVPSSKKGGLDRQTYYQIFYSAKLSLE